MVSAFLPIARSFGIVKLKAGKFNMPETLQLALSTPVDFGPLHLKHRVVMAPLTRSRSVQPDSVPGDLMIEYYGQRASHGGLIISEATRKQSKSGLSMFCGVFPGSAQYLSCRVAEHGNVTL
jgi:2,4-dienoyl-CoA reductase-like NADH-dependent reductase (Old Yellow Enzyme family)